MKSALIDWFIKLVAFLQATVWTWKALIWICKKLSELFESIWKKLQRTKANWTWSENAQNTFWLAL